MFRAQVDKSFTSCSKIYIQTSWFCFGYAYATVFEKPSFFTTKFRIELKTALLRRKGLHGYAPRYVKKLINSRSVSARYSLRAASNGNYSSLNFATSQCVFSYASPKFRNSLPLSLHEIEALFLFKKHLKAYYFNLDFEDVTAV